MPFEENESGSDVVINDLLTTVYPVEYEERRIARNLGNAIHGGKTHLLNDFCRLNKRPETTKHGECFVPQLPVRGERIGVRGQKVGS